MKMSREQSRPLGRLLDPFLCCYFPARQEGAANHSFARKCPAGSGPASMKARCAQRIISCVLVLIAVLALLLPGLGFGAELSHPPSWQPAQMWSKVDYDPKLSDPFFDADEWSYLHGGQDVVYDGMWPEGEEPPRLKHTANCFSTSFGVEHLVRFCKAGLAGADTIQLIIYDHGGAFNDRLNILIEDGMFRCQYRTTYNVSTSPHSHMIWTTKHQKLTLDKEGYRPGDEIKGRIEFECLEEPTHPKYIEKWGRHLTTIKVYGAFKAIVQSSLSAP
jgi:hypothetical protein